MAVIKAAADWRRDKVKKEGEIQLDKVTLDHIAADAAKINSTERIETERWWKEQFDATKQELTEVQQKLEAEKAWRRKTTRRLRAHQPWDHRVLARLGPEVENLEPPPPLLDEDEDEE